MKIEVDLYEDSVDAILINRLKSDKEVITAIYYNQDTDLFTDDGGELYHAICVILDYYGEEGYDYD